MNRHLGKPESASTFPRNRSSDLAMGSAKNVCRRQTTVGHRNGKMSIHVQDATAQPILISVKALKGFGAVIDFSNGDCIFQKVDPGKVIKLREEANGHLSMPLVGDMLAGACSRTRPFEGLGHE